MTLKELRKRLREAGVHNDWGILERFAEAGKDVAIGYHPPGRAEAQKSVVFSPSHKTNPGAAWYDHGQKAFYGPRSRSTPEAIEWAAEKYGVTEWSASPFGRTDKIPTAVLVAAREAMS